MVQALSNDLRGRVVEDVLGGMSRRAAAKKYRVSASFVIKLMRRYKETGCYRPLARGGDRRSYLKPHGDFIADMIAQNNAITLIDIQGRLEEKTGRIVHISVLDRFIRRMGFRYKKNGTRLRAGS